MRLKHKVEQWLAEDLITPEQGAAILKREQTPKARREWGLYGFLLVAAFSTGIGVISLIAANWVIIPTAVKLTGYFAILIASAILTLKAWWGGKATPWFEALLIFFMILCLAGIGLISQIYNIKGESHQALFFWCFVTVGLLPLSRGRWASHLYLSGFYVAFISWGLLALSESFLRKITLLQFLAFFVLAMFVHNKTKSFPFLQSTGSVLKEWAIITWLISLVAFHFSPRDLDLSILEVFFLVAAVILAFATVWVSDFKNIQKIILSCLLFLFVLLYLMYFSLKLNSLTLMIFSSLQLSLMALLFASFRRKDLFLVFIMALILRILSFYLNVFKSLTLTGFILILMGCIIVGVIQIVRKNKEKLQLWIKRIN